MAYSSWKSSWWYVTCLTGAPYVDQARVLIHPKHGAQKTFPLNEVRDIDEEWAYSQFPEVSKHFIPELLRFIHTFVADMTTNVYRYHGYKEPTVGFYPK